MTMHMAMSDRDASHGDIFHADLPKEGVGQWRKKQQRLIHYVCPMCVSFGSAHSCEFRCAIRCAKSCAAQSRWLECVINDGANIWHEEMPTGEKTLNAQQDR